MSPVAGLLTVEEAAERLGLTATRIRQFALEGRLKASKAGRAWLIRETDLRRFEQRERPAGRPPKRRRRKVV